MTAIQLYTWTTPNGRKASIALEELGLDYDVHPIDIMNDDQFDPDFLAINPNNKIPAIVDGGLKLMESGAILVYLAEKAGRLLPAHGSEAYWQTLAWTFWQVGGFGPMLGQAHHFLHFRNGTSAYAEKRYAKEARRLYGVLDGQLEGRDHLVDGLTIADIATWPWATRFEWQGIDLDDFPNVRRWYVALAERPAFRRGYAMPHDTGAIPMPA